jgi:hypothetical protein
MPVEIEWLVEGRVCYVSIPEEVDGTDIVAYDKDLIQYLDHATGKIHLIADLRILHKVPPVRQIAALRHPRHPRLGQILTIGLANNFMGRFFFTMGARVVGIQHIDFASLDEARAYLRAREGV